jgi:hypothetical protein
MTTRGTGAREAENKQRRSSASGARLKADLERMGKTPQRADRIDDLSKSDVYHSRPVTGPNVRLRWDQLDPSATALSG